MVNQLFDWKILKMECYQCHWRRKFRVGHPGFHRLRQNWLVVVCLIFLVCWLMAVVEGGREPRIFWWLLFGWRRLRHFASFLVVLSVWACRVTCPLASRLRLWNQPVWFLLALFMATCSLCLVSSLSPLFFQFSLVIIWFLSSSYGLARLAYLVLLSLPTAISYLSLLSLPIAISSRLLPA